MTQYDKSTLETLLANPAYVDEAIRLLGCNQTADELQSKGTHYQNGEGFSAAYARTGTRLYEFVTGIQTSTGKKKTETLRMVTATATSIESGWATELSAHGNESLVQKLVGLKISDKSRKRVVEFLD